MQFVQNKAIGQVLDLWYFETEILQAPITTGLWVEEVWMDRGTSTIVMTVIWLPAMVVWLHMLMTIEWVLQAVKT